MREHHRHEFAVQQRATTTAARSAHPRRTEEVLRLIHTRPKWSKTPRRRWRSGDDLLAQKYHEHAAAGVASVALIDRDALARSIVAIQADVILRHRVSWVLKITARISPGWGPSPLRYRRAAADRPLAARFLIQATPSGLAEHVGGHHRRRVIRRYYGRDEARPICTAARGLLVGDCATLAAGGAVLWRLRGLRSRIFEQNSRPAAARRVHVAHHDQHVIGRTEVAAVEVRQLFRGE